MENNSGDYSVEIVKKIINDIKLEISKVVKGQYEIVENVLIALFSEGNVLLEGVPGLGKTLLVKTVGKVIGAKFDRIQFTPDLMPSDIIGTTVLNTQINKFQVKKGPVFTDLLLADEINRAPAKTQSALLQAMQEKAVTIDGRNYELGNFFMCLATQNPIEMEGTYPLPEAQIDRFLMKLLIDYPLFEDEKALLENYRNGFNAENIDSAECKQIIKIEEFEQIKSFIQTVLVDDKIIDYITRLVRATRVFSGINVGASPRGAVSLFQASRVKAILNGRDFVVPDDVIDLVYPVLRHRIILDVESEIEGDTPDNCLTRIVESVEVPR
jgi:MoxR-like ATPase